jgi:FkbM family methyltransferase
MSLFGAFWDKDPNPVGTDNFGNNKGLFYNLGWEPKGVLHIGAWDAWEAKQYAHYCGSNSIFLEANPTSYERFKSEIEQFGQKIFNYAAWNVDDLDLDLYCPRSNPDSSSLIPQQGEIIKTKTITIQTLFERNGFKFENYDLLNIDTEGAELQVLEGIGDGITNFEYIIIEVTDLGSEFDVAINTYLESKGFEFIKDSTHHVSSVNGKKFCDKLYKKTQK